MRITSEQVEDRLRDLRGGLAQLQANMQATQGAIEDCEYWLSMVQEPDAPDSGPQQGLQE